MRNRLRKAGMALCAVLKDNLAEVLLLIGLGLIAWALWPAMGRLALLPIGVVLVWIALPARVAFVERPPVDKKPRRA